MTTMRETAINKPLGGAELRELLRADFERLLAGEGALSNHIAYGRVGWQIILRLHTANPLSPVAEIQSRPSGGTPGVEPAPLRNLSPDDEDAIGGTTLQRTITSPNAERVREGLPVPVETRQQDGTRQVEKIVYPRPKDMGDGEVTIVDSTADAKAAFGR
jgi:hypothetical protein